MPFNYTRVHWHWRGFLGKKRADFEDRATSIGVMVSHCVCRVWYRHEILMGMPKLHKKAVFWVMYRRCAICFEKNNE